jgi:hypothetical protein
LIVRRKDAHDESWATPHRRLRVEGLLLSDKEFDVAAKIAAFGCSLDPTRIRLSPRLVRVSGCLGEAENGQNRDK